MFQFLVPFIISVLKLIFAMTLIFYSFLLNISIFQDNSNDYLMEYFLVKFEVLHSLIFVLILE